MDKLSFQSILAWEEKRKNDNDSTLIFVFRAGDKESRKTNLKRIKTLKENILTPKSNIKAVFAEGDHIEGYGVIEIYVEGKLFISLPLHKNEDLPFRVCNP